MYKSFNFFSDTLGIPTHPLSPYPPAAAGPELTTTVTVAP